jgi:hypothetical protein
VARVTPQVVHDLPIIPRPMFPKNVLKMRLPKSGVMGSTSSRTFFDGASISTTKGQLGSAIRWQGDKEQALNFPIQRRRREDDDDNDDGPLPPPFQREPREIVEQIQSLFAECLQGIGDAEGKMRLGVGDRNSFPPGMLTEEACAALWKHVTGSERPVLSHQIDAAMNYAVDRALGDPHFADSIRQLEANGKSGTSTTTE